MKSNLDLAGNGPTTFLIRCELTGQLISSQLEIGSRVLLLVRRVFHVLIERSRGACLYFINDSMYFGYKEDTSSYIFCNASMPERLTSKKPPSFGLIHGSKKEMNQIRIERPSGHT